jgi:flagellar basal-body rod protein FlgB
MFDKLHKGLGNVLDLRQKQNILTAGNIANVDTPHYKAKLIRFDELLEQTMGNADFSMKQTNNRHLAGFDGTSEDPNVEEIAPPPWVLDDNSVQLEREMVRLKSNALQYNAVTKGMQRRLAILKYVASNGRG